MVLSSKPIAIVVVKDYLVLQHVPNLLDEKECRFLFLECFFERVFAGHFGRTLTDFQGPVQHSSFDE